VAGNPDPRRRAGSPPGAAVDLDEELTTQKRKRRVSHITNDRYNKVSPPLSWSGELDFSQVRDVDGLELEGEQVFGRAHSGASGNGPRSRRALRTACQREWVNWL